MEHKAPVYRLLRVFAFDPGTTAKMDTTLINEVVLRIPWEKLKPGPVGEYVAVVDQNEQGRRLNDPVDLNDPNVLARNGLPPSDGNPQFRQQMLYAVAMRTIVAFEKALGRKVHWSQTGQKYTRQLKLYPHYMNEANTYYSPEKVGVFYGYFEATAESQYPGMIVFTCLSQDVIAHSLSHALLHGMHTHLMEETNPDVYAFQEGFSDLVALLQHFSLPEVVRQQLAQTRGELTGQAMLGVLGSQFGEALGMKSGLRSALGEVGEDGAWHPKTPNPQDYRTLTESHERGSILVGAVFDALNKVYRSRVADLWRIASEGTGVLKEGELHPDLVNRLTMEASETAQDVLEMCVRALDYSPSVDITFSDYLRAIITADYDLNPNDPFNYRVAFVEAFRRYGIFLADIGTLSLETLLWPKPKDIREETVVQDFIIKELAEEFTPWNLPQEREKLYTLMCEKANKLQKNLVARKEALKGLLGEIELDQPFQVKSIWPRQHSGPNGETFSQWVIEMVQDRSKDSNNVAQLACCTLLVDAETGLVRYSIHKASGGKNAERVKQSLLERSRQAIVHKPRERKLRVYASDPSLSIQIETARINQVTLGIPWEELKRLKDGKFTVLTEDLPQEEYRNLEKLPSVPVGEYLEVVDYDPASRCFYAPVDLHHPFLLAENGLAPSQSVPQFHQQMVYAVAMRTIINFERVLGRLALWSPRWPESQDGSDTVKEEYTPHLRLYPHALREANAFYSPEKKAILFGYFQTQFHPEAAPVTVFTCLSHDIIAHEMTHALLDGMHRRFVEPSNPDMLAFHEAFADLVALFQHFSMPEVLENQIAATRGDLASQNRLGELAQEFGAAIGNRGALRSAIGRVDPKTGEWQPLQPDPEAYLQEMEPHNRGALLVATIFDAFLTLYRTRAADLLRIATHGSGVLPAGSIHPDLVHRLAGEAAACAQTVLEMCIRALDFLPPVDITFGDYLRAIVTADYELYPVDEDLHRVAFIEAFKRHGILPNNMQNYSLEGLLWEQARAFPDEDQEIVMDFITDWSKEITSWNISRDREELYNMMHILRRNLHSHLKKRMQEKKLSLIDPDIPFEVHSLRPSQRVDWQGQAHFQWIIEITQRVPEYLDLTQAKKPDSKPDYYFRGGVTLLVDAETGRVRYGIYKRLDDQERRDRQQQFMGEARNQSLYATYFQDASEQEPFAILHRF
ncbi:MAG TPA: hypothetical protein DEO88_13440 [Syntrophobacteraceae bacterium]|jgi:hypothetical protein|nr:hypothetical protein [Syntrophobacteraceae bacterium]